MSAIAFTLALAGAVFLAACALLEAVLWIDDRRRERRR